MSTGTEEALERILRCGDPNYGLTLFHCPDCQVHMAVPFSCKQRICPSCSNRRAEDVSDRLLEQLPKVTYRHVVVTLPMKMGLRKRLQQDPRLYRHVARLLHRLFCRWLPAQVGCHRNRREEREKALPGIIMAVQTFGTGLRQHPHFHCLVTDGVFFPDHQFWPLGCWNTADLCDRVRASVLQSLVARQCLSKESAAIMKSWPIERSGFSVFVGEPLTVPEHQSDVKRVLRYMLRSALPLKRLSYVERTGQVHYQDPHGPGKTWPHAVDFLADFVQHIPRARQHQVTYAGYFANALGNLSPKKAEGQSTEPKRSTGRTRWAALILRTWAVDPEQCPKCNKPMRRSRAIMDRQELLRLLHSLGLDKYPIRPRSPAPPEADDTADNDSLFHDDTNQVPADWDDWAAA
jgi:hypothetical protein